MRITDKELQKMFDKAGVSKERLHSALIKMGRRGLRYKHLKAKWSEEYPTTNYCYVIAEFVYCYFAPEGTIPYKLKGIPGDDGLHRFLRWPGGTVVDLAVDQFPNYEDVNYELGKKCPFMYPSPSSRARQLAEIYGVELPKETEDTIIEILGDKE
jgi:hypothetical protein